MSYYQYGWNTFPVLPEDLIRFAWSEPMRDLAAKIGMSDAGLRKLFVSLGIVPPPQGYWNKVRAGKPVPPQPRPVARGPGASGRCRVDRRFEPFISVAAPLSSTGPFASARVPEDLDELRIQERKAIGKATTPRALDSAHSGLRDLLAKEAKRRQKAIENRWHWDEAKFDNPLDQRRLRILNAIFLALGRRGYDGYVREEYESLKASAHVGDEHIGLLLEPAGKHQTVVRSGYKRPALDLPAGTALELTLTGSPQGITWQDDTAGKLETKIAEIAAEIIVAAEADFRDSLRRDEVARESARIEKEKRRREKLEELNQQRVKDLYASGDLLRRATELRALVDGVSHAMGNSREIEDGALQDWREWALAEADKLDPILSGQVLRHLKRPELASDEDPY